MGFCRRCGEIVPAQTARCKCGGSSVAPAVQWNHAVQKSSGSPDRWAKTYVSNNPEQEPRQPGTAADITESVHSPLESLPTKETRLNFSTSPTRRPRRFPRPLSTSISTPAFADDAVSHHIATTTAQPLVPPIRHKPTFTSGGPLGSSPMDVITSPDNATLAKVYGSVLQRPETLSIHTCASCSTVFSPDATIYPDPQAPLGAAPRFFCRPCFASHGGSKGNCANCGRNVLTATREGGFVEGAGKVWHKHCFRCDACHKDIGHAPLVDLFGRPSCAECFDSCLDQRVNLKSKKQSEPRSNIGGLKSRSRESSPALEELSERLGIKRSPALGLTHEANRHSSASFMSSRRSTLDDGSMHCQLSDDFHLRDGMSLHTPLKPSESPRSAASSPAGATEPNTPDLSSDSSDSVSSLSPSTPSNSPRQSFTPTSQESVTPKARGIPTRLSVVTTNDSKCGRCSQPLFNTTGEGRIVTVPADSLAEEPVSYHAACFRCSACGDTFNGGGGQAVFVKDSRGVCHPECAKSIHNHNIKNVESHVTSNNSPRQCPNLSPEQPPASAPPLARSFPRFGGSEACSGCGKAVSLMEYGVVPGPQNSRWHSACLVCGGKGSKPPRPGCGKRLDSAAKTDKEGGVWCRECMLLLPAGAYLSPQGSPTRGRLIPSYTGSGIDRFPRPAEAGRLFGQVTGNSFVRSDTLMVQFTGGGPSPMRRGSVSPTRQMTRSVSPTKGLMPVTRHPRPIGTWKHRSVDEGRGMFLVKQMTGNGH